MKTNFMLAYRKSADGVQRQFFDSWEAAKSAGDALNTDSLDPNVDLAELVSQSWEYESGIFDRHGNRFAVVSSKETP